LVTARLVRLWRSRTWWLTIEGVQITGKTDLNNGIKLDYGFQRARSLERYENDLFVNGTNATTPDPLQVEFQPDAIKFFPSTPGSTAVLLNPATQRISLLATSSLRKDWETEKTPYLNVRKEFALSNGGALELKTGTYIRLKEKANPNVSVTQTPLASSTLTFADLGTNGTIDDFDAKGIALGPRPDPEIGKLIAVNNPGSFGPPVVGIAPGDVNMFDANEDIYAGYLMGTYTKNKLTLIAGARYEKTDEAYKRLTANVGGVYKEFTDSYDNFLPSVHVKYELAKDMFLRASWANTVGRPNAESIYGVETIDTVNLTINQPNPGLKALESENFDLSIDWYSGPLGQFMAGVFTKDITNFPLSITDQIQLNGATYTRTSVQAKANGKISGYELSFRRNLDFLPGIFSGLGVDVNYAGLDSELDHATRTDNPRLPDQPEYVLNASLYYAYKGFFTRFALSEEGSMLSRVAGTAIQDRIRDVFRTFDFTASYDFGRKHTYQAFFEWRNITNEHSQARYGAGTLQSRTGSGANIGLGLRFRY
jgi:TonB-dependent receptor